MALTEIDGSALGPTAQRILGRRNLVINGAMNIAQRGTSSTSTGYQTVDRFDFQYGGTDEAPTQAQVDITADTDPWNKGFRKAFKITNGNQTGGAGAADFQEIIYKFEAQDIASSGWDYTSATSYITVSFWIKSSVAQNFYGFFRTHDGTAQAYPFETGSLSADTWTQGALTIPGNTNIQVDNNNAVGLTLYLIPFYGTDYTATPTLNTWAAYASGTRTPANTSTWWTTNNATLEITGVQVEVANSETEFEHLTYAEDLRACQRYFYMHTNGADNTTSPVGQCTMYTNTSGFGPIFFKETMRATPTLHKAVGTDYFIAYGRAGSDAFDNVALQKSCPTCFVINYYDGLSNTGDDSCWVQIQNAAARIGFDAEL